MIIEDLLWASGLQRYASKPEMDPLRDPDALIEAQLLDVRVHVRTSTAALLFGMWTALQIREGNTAVLVAHGVRSCSWMAERRRGRSSAWPAGSSGTTLVGGLLNFDIGFLTGARLHLSAESMAFFVGDVPPRVGPPPDYGDDDEATIRAGLPGWRSEFFPIRAAFLHTRDLNDDEADG